MSSSSLCVVMATYNGSKYIAAQLHSICRQLAPSDSFVLVDDASIDDTPAIAKSILSSYGIDLIFLQNEVNLGPCRTFEAALLNVPSSADYVVISDQDDIWFEDRLDVIRRNSERFKSIILNSYIFKGFDSEYPLLRDTFSVCAPSYSYVNNLIRPSFIGCHLAFDSSFLKLALPFPCSVYMYDMLIGLCILLYRESSLIVNVPTMLYRRHDNVFTPSRTSLLFKFKVRCRYALTLVLIALRSLTSKYA